MPADMSQTERLRRLKAQIQAIGPYNPSTQSIWLIRRFGQIMLVEESCCGCTIPNFDDLNNAIAPNGKQLILISVNKNKTITFKPKGEPNMTLPYAYIHTDLSINYDNVPQIVYINDSSQSITIEYTYKGHNSSYQLNPCGATPS